jgi:hypothetical protein
MAPFFGDLSQSKILFEIKLPLTKPDQAMSLMIFLILYSFHFHSVTAVLQRYVHISSKDP